MRPRLFGFELAWAEAAMGAIFPEGSALVHGIARLKPGAFLDDMLADGLLMSRIYAVRQLGAGFKAMGSLCLSQSKEIRKQMNSPSATPLLETSSLVRVKAGTRTTEGHEHAAE